jgi:hypothetical protein
VTCGLIGLDGRSHLHRTLCPQCETERIIAGVESRCVYCTRENAHLDRESKADTRRRMKRAGVRL